MKKLISEEEFFKKYNIDANAFKKTTLKWEDLQNIYSNYCKEIPKLEASAIYIFNSLMKASNVHSVRYRIKETEHVIEKIIRKKIEEPKKILRLIITNQN